MGDGDKVLQEVFLTFSELNATCPNCNHMDTVEKFWRFGTIDPTDVLGMTLGFHHSSFLAGEPVGARRWPFAPTASPACS